MMSAEDLWSFERDLAQFFPPIHPDHGFVRHLETELEHEVTHWHQVRAWFWGAALVSLILTGGIVLWLVWRYSRRWRRETFSAL